MRDALLSIGDLVSKVGGDYRFDGVIVAKFRKLSGVARFVVEDDRGILHIFKAPNLRLRSDMVAGGPTDNT
jgi:hypothetical protein